MGRFALLVVAIASFASCAVPVGAPTATAARSLEATPSPTTSAAPTNATIVPTATPTPTPTTPATPNPTSGTGAAPYCAIADVLTPNAAYGDHVRTYLDWTYALRDTYLPPDLVSATSGAAAQISPFAIEAIGAAELRARRGDTAYATLLTDDPRSAVREVVYPDLAALRAAALAAGHRLVIVSAYRSYQLQAQTFEYWTRVGGYEQALRTSARPGHSEHQLGTAVDFGDGSAAPWEYVDWAGTPTGGWLAAHAADFGFVMSFPKGKTNVTCYDYEPWHYRWVGKTIAQQLVASRLALREYQTSGLR